MYAKEMFVTGIKYNRQIGYSMCIITFDGSHSALPPHMLLIDYLKMTC